MYLNVCKIIIILQKLRLWSLLEQSEYILEINTIKIQLYIIIDPNDAKSSILKLFKLSSFFVVPTAIKAYCGDTPVQYISSIISKSLSTIDIKYCLKNSGSIYFYLELDHLN